MDATSLSAMMLERTTEAEVRSLSTALMAVTQMARELGALKFYGMTERDMVKIESRELELTYGQDEITSQHRFTSLSSLSFLRMFTNSTSLEGIILNTYKFQRSNCGYSLTIMSTH